MQFVKLRISGFKSFVDQTELVIEPGMTGIVGPNGCGKSNLVEALRWVMGETSAKKMRGDDMDDVIFGGTDKRPARNIAEVCLGVDNASRTAPAGFNDFDELDIQRRIERGSGSDYRINGKLVRARDVQLLFADNASGANSPALVSQGRIGTIINSKPTERRVLLEEAAGITGLHSRRHEAELRLKAAEANLLRLDDVIVTMDAQLGTLKKQARQASRYRNISEQIRKTEAVLLHLRWVAAEGALAEVPPRLQRCRGDRPRPHAGGGGGNHPAGSRRRGPAEAAAGRSPGGPGAATAGDRPRGAGRGGKARRRGAQRQPAPACPGRHRPCPRTGAGGGCRDGAGPPDRRAGSAGRGTGRRGRRRGLGARIAGAKPARRSKRSTAS